MVIYKDNRLIDGKPRWVITDEDGNITNRNPSKDELKGLKIVKYKKILYSDKELIDALKRFYGEKGRVPTENDLANNPDYPCPRIYSERIGWNNAIISAGLHDKRDTKKKYTDEELLNSLKEFYDEHGRVPVANDFNNNPKYPSDSTIIIRFGRWNNAIDMAELSEKRLYTEAELLNGIKRFYTENNRIPVSRDFRNNSKYPSYYAYMKFGGLQKALKLVGLDIDTLYKKGLLKPETNQQKGRLFELIILYHFEENPIDLSGEKIGSSCDGICPNGKIYEVKSSKLYDKENWKYNTRNKEKENIEIFYFGAFNEDYSKLLYVWRVPGELVEGDVFRIGMSHHGKFNIENMKEFDITDKILEIIKEKNISWQ